MDISNTIAPKSDQQNYDDYIAGPRTVTIAEVRKGNAEQPVQILLQEFPGRPYKPSKSMRRVLVNAWGKHSSAYAGRSMTLYGDPAVKFGGEAVGGIKISHLSHIDRPVSIALTETRGKKTVHTVEPLRVAPRVTAEQVEACDDPETLRRMWYDATPDVQQLINARGEQLMQKAQQATSPVEEAENPDLFNEQETQS